MVDERAGREPATKKGARSALVKGTDIMARVSLALLMLSALSLALASTSSTNNWAVILSGSTFWFNYRHQANAMGMCVVSSALCLTAGSSEA